MNQVNQDRMEGTLRTAAGRTQEAYGVLTGDREQEARGARSQAAARLQQAYGQTRETLRDAADTLSRNISDRPMAAVLIAGAVGLLIGMLTTAGRSDEARWSGRQRY